jgi:hypothetical protein
VVPDCPNAETTTTVVRGALDEFGLSFVPIATVLVTCQEQAEQAGFVGSPTIMIDGRDPFADPSQKPGLAHRVAHFKRAMPLTCMHCVKRCAGNSSSAYCLKSRTAYNRNATHYDVPGPRTLIPKWI